MHKLLTLVKPKRKKQHHCRTARQRRLNVKGCFAVKNPSIVRNKTIVVVDDVITSGATFSECANVLRLAGAAEVYGIFLARTNGW
jgi:predicted amidophosphoribosyltransferase